jgi:predicted  nucleic acid-binding Zn-ribbon protein
MQGFRELIQLHLAEQAERETSRKQDALRSSIEQMQRDIETARAQQQAAEEHVKHLHLERKKVELDVQQHEGTRKKYREQLMSAKTNEIYKTLLHEIEHEAGLISALETRVLEMMEEADGASVEIETAKKAVAAAEARRGAEERTLLADITALEEERSACRTRAKELEPLVDTWMLTQYRRIAEQRDGRGLALVRDFQCTECRVAVRPQAWVDMAIRQEPSTCAGCKRLLYREDNLRPNAGTPAAAS